MAKVDAAAVTAMLARMSKLVGAPESVLLTLAKKQLTLGCTVDSIGASLLLSHTLEAASEEQGSAGVPFDVLRSALKGRGEVDLRFDGNTLALKGAGRYTANLMTHPLNAITPPDKAGASKSASALALILERHSRALALRDLVDDKRALLVVAKWDPGEYQVAVTDNQHAVYIEGKGEIKGEGTLAVYDAELSRIAEVGGVFRLKDNEITATSDGAWLKFRRLPQDEGVVKVPIDKVAQLAKTDPEWSCLTTVSTLFGTLENLSAVLEVGNGIALDEDKNGNLIMKASSKHGTIKAKLDATEFKNKKAFKGVRVNPQALASVLGCMNGPVRMSVVSNNMRIESRSDESLTVGMLRLMGE